MAGDFIMHFYSHHITSSGEEAIFSTAKPQFSFMIKVKKQRGESDDRLIARFRKKVIESGVLWEYRDKERHKSASEKRKEKKYRIRHMIDLEKSRD